MSDHAAQSLPARVTALEELVTFQEDTIEALNQVVIELRGSVDTLEEQVANLKAMAVNQPGNKPDSALPDRPGTDPEAPPHY